MGFDSTDNSRKSGGGLQVSEIVEDVVRRRLAGERVDDGAVIDAHPHLSHGLAEKLGALRMVELARQHADGTTASTSGSPIHSQPAGGRLNWRSDSIAGLDIVEEVHRGGQGVVYRAIKKTTGREVAVKVMRDGPFLVPRDKTRFDREVRILGQLQHPNIVTIHDSGMAAGLSYFVMDYIPGQPLDSYMSARKRPVKETLRLFVKICEAVTAAHLRGVIHRDLKPSNIRIDRRGEPHILDFGLAKMAPEHIEDATQWRTMTMTGQFVGSLPWASPEQADGVPDSVDLRTDIYSLGVILYHMLTQEFPYPVDGNARQVLRHITESDPFRPGALRNDIDADVDTIVLKCLSKERQRRYQSTAALADDIERYLTNQPILARPSSTIYLLKKLVIRHRLPFALTIALFVLMAAFAIWMSMLYSEADENLTRAVAAEKEAASEAETARAVNDFLINDMLASAHPSFSKGNKITVEESLANASERIEHAFVGQPVLRASILYTIGQAYLALGLYEAAEEHFREAESIQADELGNGYRDTTLSRTALIGVLIRQGREHEAEALAARTLEDARDTLGEEHKLTLQAAYHYAVCLWHLRKTAEAIELLRRTLERQRRILGDDHPHTLASMQTWGGAILWDQGRTAEAEHYCRLVLEGNQRRFGRDHPGTLGAMSILGQILQAQGRLQEAEPLLRDAYEGQRRVLGEEHMDTLSAAMGLALLFRDQSRLDEAEALFRQTAESSRAVLGEDHAVTQGAMQYLGSVHSRQGNYGEAADIFRELLEIRRRLYGDEHPNTAAALTSLSAVLFKLGQYAEAETGFRQALQAHGWHPVGPVERRAPGEDRVNTLWPLRWLVKTLAAQGKLEEARPLARELLEGRRRVAERPDADANQLAYYARELATVEPSDLRDPELAITFGLRAAEIVSDADPSIHHILALAYHDTGDLDKAIETMQQALAITPVEQSWARAAHEALLVRFFDEMGEYDAAEQVYRDSLAARRQHFSEGHIDIASSLDDLGQLLVRHHKYAEAEPLLRECLDIQTLALSERDWRIGNTKSLLGAALAGQGALAEAEQLLVEGYGLMTDSAMAYSDQAHAALDRIVDFYESQGTPHKADGYRATQTTKD